MVETHQDAATYTFEGLVLQAYVIQEDGLEGARAIGIVGIGKNRSARAVAQSRSRKD